MYVWYVVDMYLGYVVDMYVGYVVDMYVGYVVDMYVGLVNISLMWDTWNICMRDRWKYIHVCGMHGSRKRPFNNSVYV